ncbi:hypothetical protein KY320_02570, partial [Candidatus Woesearchaeota archaeon]|nr:hypothetical protein [Candidatus Woesearchaeota archaeon]
GLKGKNRSFIEKNLVNNLKDCLSRNKIDFGYIRRQRGRIFIDSNRESTSLLKNVFGISSLSYAEEVGLDMKSIQAVVSRLVSHSEFENFRISVQRLNKEFSLSSMELEKELGAFVVEKFGKKVKLEQPELNIQIEIADKAYIFNERIQGFGGLPIGTQGKVVCWINNSKSLLAAILMMRRGCKVVLAGRMLKVNGFGKYNYGSILEFYPAGSFKEVEEIASRLKIKAIVVDHTLKDYAKLDSQMLVLRPLIAFSEKDIELQREKYFG